MPEPIPRKQVRQIVASIKRNPIIVPACRCKTAQSQANPWFKRGTVYRRAFDAMRTATEPLTAREIAERVLVAANVTDPDKAALSDLTGSVPASLRNHNGGCAAHKRGTRN
jgi:hypothetical protein